MPCICPKYFKKVMPKICPRNTPDMINTIPRYAQGMLEISPRYDKVMPKIHAINFQDKHNICQSFRICLTYAKDMP